MSSLPPSSSAALSPTGAASGGVSPASTVGPAPRSLKQRAVHSGAWSFAGFVLGQGLRFGSNLALAYLLAQNSTQAFGLMMFVGVCMAGLEMFSDIGIGPSIIQNKRSDAAFLNTAWTIQVGRGFLLWLGAAALAHPFSVWWEEPALRYLLPVAGVTAAIAGFNATSLFTLNRELTLAKVVLLKLGSQIVSAVVMVAWAWFHPTVWALVAGGIAGALVRMAVSHLFMDRLNRFSWDPTAASSLIRFGRWIFISTALTFLAGRIDKFIFPMLLGFELFGIFSVAFSISSILPQVMRQLNSVVGFAALADVYRRDEKRFRWRLRHVRMLLIFPTNAALLILAAAGPWAIDLVYPDLFHEAGWMLTALAVGAMATTINSTYGNAHLSMGDSLYVTISVAVQLVLMVPAVFLGHHLAGAMGFIYAGMIVLWLLYPLHAVMAIHKRIWQPMVDLPVLTVCGLVGLYLLWP